MKYFILILSVALGVYSSHINSAVLYSYTSNPYEVVRGSYDTETVLTAQFTLANELAPNLNYQLFTPLSFSFSDKFMTITDSSSFLSQQYFEVSTDSAGLITSWVMYATESTPTEYIGGSTSTREDESWKGTGSGYVLYKPNMWSVASVPIPGAVWLFGSGLIGLIGVARRKKA